MKSCVKTKNIDENKTNDFYQEYSMTYMLSLSNDISKIIMKSCVKMKNIDENKTNDFYQEYSFFRDLRRARSANLNNFH
jgi:hypothetical protein